MERGQRVPQHGAVGGGAEQARAGGVARECPRRLGMRTHAARELLVRVRVYSVRVRVCSGLGLG